MTEKEYNECVNLYADNVFRFIIKNLRHEEDARDVVQTAFEKLWRNREEVVYEKSKAYLFTVAYNQMIDHIRKESRISLKEDFKDDVSIQQPKQNLKKILEHALSRLNETQRSLVMLKDYEGYSYEEIGKITGLSESQVKVYLHRARLQLKEYLVKMENLV
ncbi:MAG: RNA polymerase sigma factor [Agriterribacter sp.]